MFEKHCVKVITDCYKRNYAIKLSETLVTQILINEKASFDYPWLKNVEFSNRYVHRFIMEHDLSYFFRISRKFQKCVTFKHVTFTHDSVFCDDIISGQDDVTTVQLSLEVKILG